MDQKIKLQESIKSGNLNESLLIFAGLDNQEKHDVIIEMMSKTDCRPKLIYHNLHRFLDVCQNITFDDDFHCALHKYVFSRVLHRRDNLAIIGILGSLNTDVLNKLMTSKHEQATLLQVTAGTKNIELIEHIIKLDPDYLFGPPNCHLFFQKIVSDPDLFYQVNSLLIELEKSGTTIPDHVSGFVQVLISKKNIEALEMVFSKESVFYKHITDPTRILPFITFAAHIGSPDVINSLDKCGADFYTLVDQGLSPLHTAILNGKMDCFWALYEIYRRKSTEPGNPTLREICEKKITSGLKCISIAIRKNNLEVVKTLIEECGVDINVSSDDEILPPLIQVVGLGRIEMLEYLIGLNPDPNVLDRMKNNVFCYLATKKRLKMGSMMLDYVYKVKNASCISYYVTWINVTSVDYGKTVSVRLEKDVFKSLKNIKEALIEKTAVKTDGVELKISRRIVYSVQDEYDGHIIDSNKALYDFIAKNQKELFDKIFYINADGEYELRYCLNSPSNDEVYWVRLIGMLIAVCVMTGISLGRRLSENIIRYLSGESGDIKSGSTWKNYQLVRDADPETLEQMQIPFGLTFQTNVGNYHTEMFGQDDFVTIHNRPQYLEKFEYFTTKGGDREAILKALKCGFNHTISPTVLRVELWQKQIVPHDILNRILMGDDVTIETVKSGTVYINCEPDTKQVIWFWEFFENQDVDKFNKMLQFATCSGHFNSWEMQAHGNFQITLSDRQDILPIVHTCSLTIILPSCDSRETLFDRLGLVLEEYDGLQTTPL